MREVAWRVYPTALDDQGLGSVLNRIADHCPVPVRILELPDRRLPQAVESAAYFFVREAVTNVVKHAGASPSPSASMMVRMVSSPRWSTTVAEVPILLGRVFRGWPAGSTPSTGS